MEKANLLKHLIKIKYKTLSEFCHKIDINPSTLSTIFARGVGNSSISVMLKICNELDLSLDNLLDLKVDSFYCNDIEKELIQKLRLLPSFEQAKIIGIVEYKLSDLNIPSHKCD